MRSSNAAASSVLRVFLLTAVTLTIQLPVGARAAEPDPAQQAPDDTVPAVEARAWEILAQLDSLMDTGVENESRWMEASGEDADILREYALQLNEQAIELQAELLGLIPQLRAVGAPMDSIRQIYGSFISAYWALGDEALVRYEADIYALADRRSSIPADSLPEIEDRIAAIRGQIDTMLVNLAGNLSRADSVDAGITEGWDRLERFTLWRADQLVRRLQVVHGVRARLQTRIENAEDAGAPESQVGQLRIRHQAADQHVHSAAASLRAMAAILDGRGYDTDPYRLAVILATGELTGELLDPGVLLGVLRDLWERIWSWFWENALTLLVRLLVVIAVIALFRVAFRVGWWVVRKIGLPKSGLLRDMLGQLIRPVSTILGLVIGLSVVGVNTTALLAGIGIVGLIVGFALQDSLSNLAAGVFILTTRPYDVDDVIEAGGVLGTVRAMAWANTTIVTFDNRRLLVPNRKIWSDIIENRSAERVRRVEGTVSIAYEEDLYRAIKVVHGLLDEDERVLNPPEPLVFTSKLADSGVELSVWPWVKNEDWWSLTTELHSLIHIRFKEEGIKIPYPHMEIVMSPDSERAEAEAEDPAASQ